MMSLDNCGGSDLTAEHMADGSNSRTSSNLHDQGSIHLKLDKKLTQTSETVAKAALPARPELIRGGSVGTVQGRSMSSPFSAVMQQIESEGKGSALMDRISSTATLNLGRDWRNKGEDWLELRLGSVYANPRSPSRIRRDEITSSREIDLAHHAPLEPWPHVARGREVQENGKITALELNGRDATDVAAWESSAIERAAEARFPYPYNISLERNSIGNDISHERNSISALSLISSFDRSHLHESIPLSFYNSRLPVSAVYTAHGDQEARDGMEESSAGNVSYQNSELNSKSLQRTIDRIQSRNHWSSRDFSWRASMDAGSFVRPLSGAEEIGRRTSQLPRGSINGGVQYPPRQQFSIWHPAENVTHLRGQTVSGTAGLQTKISANTIDKSARTEPGVWFTLQVAHNQGGGRILPQVPKTYIRIKDGTMTIAVVKKYLASKLGLKNDSEIVITCKGQEVMPFLTIQHVRDTIWFSNLNKCGERNEERRMSISNSSIFITNYSCNEHLMILHYQECPNTSS